MRVSFSVIIPVYNTEKFITKCLDSVLKQTYKEYDVIIVNDGSTDSSAEIVECYEKKYDRIQVVTQANKGLGGARNTGIASAKGDYLVFLDSDDYIREDMLEIRARRWKPKTWMSLAFDAYTTDSSGGIVGVRSCKQYNGSRIGLSEKDLLIDGTNSML